MFYTETSLLGNIYIYFFLCLQRGFLHYLSLKYRSSKLIDIISYLIFIFLIYIYILNIYISWYSFEISVIKFFETTKWKKKYI